MFIWKTKQKIRRLFSRKAIEANTIVILCNPRSGSTWLMDALRCHPHINIHPSASFYNRFALDGKRYPGDMSAATEQAITIEVLPQVKQAIPQFKIPFTNEHPSDFIDYALEKIHPEFYNFKTEPFLQQLKSSTADKHQFKFILLMRHPLSAMQSFYSYQKRNPKWYDWMDADKLVKYTLDTFESMAIFQAEFGGMVLDYANFLNHPKKTLSKIYQYVWDYPTYFDSPFFQKDVQQSIVLTQREKRAISGTSFLGKKTGKIAIQMEDLPFYDKKYKVDMERMVQLFEQLKTANG